MDNKNDKTLRTLCFLIKKGSDEKATDVCLGMKKVRFGQGLWAGIGGKIESGETIEEAVAREVEEEIGVEVENIQKVAETDFRFPHKPDWSQYVYVYMTDNWNGEIKESQEMRPEWFKLEEIPYDSMWEDAKHWLPQVLNGEKIKGIFTYGEDDHIFEKSVEQLQV